MKPRLIKSLLATSLAGSLLLSHAWAENTAVTQDSDALSQVPPPPGVGAEEQQLRAAVAADPYAPTSAAGTQTAPDVTDEGAVSAPVATEPSPTETAPAASDPTSAASSISQPPALQPETSAAPMTDTVPDSQQQPAAGTAPPAVDAAAGGTPPAIDAAAGAAPPAIDAAPSAVDAAAGATPSAVDSTTAAPAQPAPLPVVETPMMAPALLFQPTSSEISVAQMGQPRGITLTGGQLQSGIVFTLPADQVITNARLMLSLRVSTALAARNTSLQLMLNGQPLGTLPLGAADSDVSDYQLDIPAAMVVSSNNLSFKINDADKLLCERDSATQNRVTIMPTTRLLLEGQQLNTGTSLRNFPRPFIDPMQMTEASVPMVFPAAIDPAQVSAAAMVASWLGIQTDYRGVSFPVMRDRLPEKNGIVFAHPGDKIGVLTVPAGTAARLMMIDNPNNPIYKLMLVIGSDDEQLRQAAYRLVSQPLTTDAASLTVVTADVPQRQAYDAPRWINTTRPVRLRELLRSDQSLTTNGLWHDALRVNFRAAPDLFLWDGDAIPVQLNYRFPAETWIDENNSYLNVMLNGTFLRNLSVNKLGLLEDIWRRLGGDARQEAYRLELDPYLIYGDNQLALYFNIAPKADAPCGVLLNNNIKSRIEEDSFIDLSHTRHFAMLPNLAYFVGASFPFSQLADYSQTTLLLPEQPSDSEISTLLDLASRSGNATGVALHQNHVLFGIPQGGTSLTRLKNSDVLAVSTVQQSAFTRAMLAKSDYDASGTTLGVKAPGVLDKMRSWLTGDWSRQQLDADRYFSSNEAWRGFVSYASPWNPGRLVVMSIASNDAQLLRLHSDLNAPGINAGIRGDTAIITDENGIRSFRVGPQSPRGEMPWYMMVFWYANQHSVLLALSALLLAAIAGSATWVMLKHHARRRLPSQNDNSQTGKK